MAESNAQLARRVFAALSEGDVEAFAALVDPDAEIHTSRGIRRGSDKVAEWAEKGYEHLERRYAIDELQVDGDDVLALVRTQYVWRDGGELGDEEPTVIELSFRDGRLVRWKFREDLAAEHGGAGKGGE